jgi:hypothetical protein
VELFLLFRQAIHKVIDPTIKFNVFAWDIIRITHNKNNFTVENINKIIVQNNRILAVYVKYFEVYAKCSGVYAKCSGVCIKISVLSPAGKILFDKKRYVLAFSSAGGSREHALKSERVNVFAKFIVSIKNYAAKIHFFFNNQQLIDN